MCAGDKRNASHIFLLFDRRGRSAEIIRVQILRTRDAMWYVF